MLQSGQSIEYEHKTYVPTDVCGEPRKGIKLTYVTDTRPTDLVKENARNSDLLICEGMYGEQDKIKKAREYKHMTFKEAAYIAAKANPKEMWLTHYSPSLIRPKDYMKQVTDVFPNAVPGKDGMSVDLMFEE